MSQRYSFLDLQALAAQWYQNSMRSGQVPVLTPYGYNVTVTSLAAAATSTQSLSITANADFILTGIRYRAMIAAAAQTVSNKTAAAVRLLITDTGTNEQFTNSAIDLENYSTNGGDARDLPYPRLIQGRTALSLQFTSFAAAETYAPLDLYLEGVLVRLMSGQG